MRLILLLAASSLTTAAHAETGLKLGPDFEPVVAGLETAWNTADGPAWGRLFWDDADSVNIYGGTLHGGVEMGARHAVVWKGRAKGSKLHIEVRNFRQVDDNVALIDMIQLVDRPASPEAKLKVYVTSVLQRRQGAWRIVHVQNTPMSTPPAE